MFANILRLGTSHNTWEFFARCQTDADPTPMPRRTELGGGGGDGVNQPEPQVRRQVGV